MLEQQLRQLLVEELRKMGVSCKQIMLLQNKDGVVVARIVSGSKRYVLKYYEQKAYAREIANYRILTDAGIPTIQMIAFTETALLLEDIDCSDIYRLGTADDLADPIVARCIARWYRQLHQAGYRHIQPMYVESELFSKEHISIIKEKIGLMNTPVWECLDQHIDEICRMAQTVKKTFTYNDFYYTNLIVAKDDSKALMFDYNLLGKGYAYADLRNVTSSLSEQATEAFLDEYGVFDPFEKALDAVISPVITLYFAYQRERFPAWAESSKTEICSAGYLEQIDALLHFGGKHFV